MTFLTELARLKAAATKGPWRYDGTCALKGPQLETTSLHGQVVRYRDTLAQFVASKSGNENANLTAYLRNHADAIEALVKAAESAHRTLSDEGFHAKAIRLGQALAALDAGKGET